MPYYNSSDRAVKDLTPQIHTRTFWGENLLAGLVVLDPDAILPAHSHPHEQITFIINGELHFDLGGEQRTLHHADLAVIPSGMSHSAVAGPKGALVLDVFSPPREDMKY